MKEARDVPVTAAKEVIGELSETAPEDDLQTPQSLVRRPEPSAAAAHLGETASATPKLSIRDLSVFYGEFRAVRDVTFEVPEDSITAIIGPSGCGKSTLLRVLNRMTELVPGARATGEVIFDGVNILDPEIDPVDLRRRVGMVFQRPNPFPKTIYDNVAFGPRLYGIKGSELDGIVEQTLRDAALWDEVNDKLRRSALSLSGGQQQRLCIARTMAVQPEVILMDEPASALDPVATLRIEELMGRLRERFTIVIVTHNMQQAARVSDQTAFFTMGDDRAGYLVELGATQEIFTSPRERLTEDYVSGRFG
jgi:phosphate transport system ATP-binding protein